MSTIKQENHPDMLQLPQVIEIAMTDPSPYQHRKHFNEAKLREIGESILSHGQWDDAIVRRKADGRYELIAGERRMRGSALVGLTTLRCKVVPMTDDEARDAVMIQQLQHEDWLPSEEAAAYAELLALVDESGRPRHTLVAIAARINKSEAHIRELVALMDVPEAMRSAVDREEVSKRAALIVAGVADEQDRVLAAEMVMNPAGKASPLTSRETLVMVQQRFQRSLAKAPFSLKDVKLLPEAGSCEACPLRTGNVERYKDLLQSRSSQGYGGTAGIPTNLCTKPSCYLQKCQAIEAKVIEAARERGCAIMEDDEAEEIFDAEGLMIEGGEYVDRDGKPDPTLCHHYNEGKMPTWKKLIETQGVTVKAWLARNPETGELVEMILWKEAVAAVNAACVAAGVEVFFKAAGMGHGAQGTEQQQGGDEPGSMTERIVEAEREDAQRIRKGDHIILPDKEEDPMWDGAADKANKQGERERERDATEKLKGLLTTMDNRLDQCLMDEVAHDRVLGAFAEDMLSLAPDGVVDDMAREYGVQAETESTCENLARFFMGMGPDARWGFMIMIMIRSMVKRHGVENSTVQEWAIFLEIEEHEEGAQNTTVDAAESGEEEGGSTQRHGGAEGDSGGESDTPALRPATTDDGTPQLNLETPARVATVIKQAVAKKRTAKKSAGKKGSKSGVKSKSKSKKGSGR